MININKFGIIGGDKRQLAAARAIANDGYAVTLSCFDKLDSKLYSFAGYEEPED